MKLNLLATFLCLYYLESSSAAEKTNGSVIIVGAGAAGIATARKLLDNDFSNFIILEAENRIGGRVQSVFFGDAFIDLGGEFCHGVAGNLVYDLAKDFNILRSSNWTPMVVLSSGKNLSNFFNDVLLELIGRGNYESKMKLANTTLGDYFIQKFNNTIYTKYGKNPEQLSLAKSSINLFRHLVLGDVGASSWFEPSAYTDYIYSDGDDTLNWNGFGYKTILEILLKKFPNPQKQLPIQSKIFFNKKVAQINWNENGTTAVCMDGSSYFGDAIVFTPSVGVLKAQHSSIFHPPLPADKIDAINRIGISAVMKVPLYFQENWWDNDNFNTFLVLWTDEDEISSLQEFPKGPSKNGRSWITDLVAFDSTPANPNVLIVWFTGDQVPQIEQISDEVLLSGIEYVLRKFLDLKFNTTMPSAFLRTSWYSNPNFRGCYSYQTLSSIKYKKSAEMELSDPVLDNNGRPILMFAGEATNPTHFSTVHGAIETGFREADRIINHYN